MHEHYASEILAIEITRHGPEDEDEVVNRQISIHAESGLTEFLLFGNCVLLNVSFCLKRI